METNDWLASEGGPLILLHIAAVPSWRGVGDDYDRACAVDEDVQPLGGVPQALVLGDEPDATTLRPHDAGVVIVRWRSAPSPAAMEAAIQAQLPLLVFETVCTFETRPGSHVLFDAACDGRDVEQSLVVELDASIYDVATAWITGVGTEALVHRLVRAFR